MAIYIPTLFKKSIFEITVEVLNKIEIKGIILDVDNTLTMHHCKEPYDGITDWLSKIKSSGFKVIIASNNTKKRVSEFAKLLDLDYVSMSCKPFPFGLKRAYKVLGTKPKQTVIIGDQLFTDILGGNFLGIKTILVDPFEPEKNVFFRVKRKLEKILINKHKK